MSVAAVSPKRSAANLQRCVRSWAGLLASGLLVLPASGVAAENDVQLWPVVSLNHSLGERWGAHLQTRARFDEDVSEAKDFLVRPFISWTPIESLTFDLGYDYLHSFRSSPEHRVWQAAEHHFQWRDLTVKNRVRLDERIVEDVGGAVVRFRYRLRGTHPIAGSQWYAAISDEVMANLNDYGTGPVSGLEQNRLRFAVGVPFLERLRVESGYEWQYIERRDSSARHFHVFVVEFTIDTGGLRLLPFSPR
jgi:hypothetical protein